VLILSPEAEQDLLDIWLYIAADNSVSADRFLAQLEQRAMALAEFREIGIDRPELGRDIRSFPAYRYVLYYRPGVDGVEIVRVLHGSRDVGPGLLRDK